MIVERVILLCVGAALICATLRAQRPEAAMVVALAAGVVALSMALEPIAETARAYGALAEAAGIASGSARTLLRAAGISLIAEFGAQICRDAGEGTLATRIEMIARVSLLAMSLPLLTALMARLGALIAE